MGSGEKKGRGRTVLWSVSCEGIERRRRVDGVGLLYQRTFYDDGHGDVFALGKKKQGEGGGGYQIYRPWSIREYVSLRCKA